MYKVLDKDTIEMEIVPHIPLSKREFAPTAPWYEIVNAILYKLKTGVQWEYLPTAAKRAGPPTPSSLPIGRDFPWPCRNWEPQ